MLPKKIGHYEHGIFENVSTSVSLLNQTDFIRNAIKYYNPKLTQELFDKIVNIMQSRENDAKIVPF